MLREGGNIKACIRLESSHPDFLHVRDKLIERIAPSIVKCEPMFQVRRFGPRGPHAVRRNVNNAFQHQVEPGVGLLSQVRHDLLRR